MLKLRGLIARLGARPGRDQPAEPLPEKSDATVPFRQGPDVLQLAREELAQLPSPRVLEVGSRVVDGIQLRTMLGLDAGHVTGFDYRAGSNVDVVGDAHEMSRLLPGNHFDAVVSKSVFEHLAMPWKVVLETNKILRTGGLVFVNTEQTFPLHELPWDFFRFSDQSWHALFNRFTGFEVVAIELNTPCRIVPRGGPIAGWAEDHVAYVNSNVLARKTGAFDADRVRWDVAAGDVLDGAYPR